MRYAPVWEEMLCKHEAPTRIHNNCSGKHAGFLTLAKHLGAPTKGYERHDHPVQIAVARATAELAGVDIDMPWGVDGCAAPNFALPLSGFARALAKLADPSSLSPPVRQRPSASFMRWRRIPNSFRGRGGPAPC